jgi:hypothetical protein
VSSEINRFTLLTLNITVELAALLLRNGWVRGSTQGLAIMNEISFDFFEYLQAAGAGIAQSV